MPATDEYWRNLPRMHQWFAVSAIVLLGATVLMMFKDEARWWRVVQSEFEDLKVDKLERQLAAAQTPEVKQQIDQANAALAEAQQQWNNRDAAVREQEAELARLNGELQILQRVSKGLNAERDKARADYDLKVRDEAPAEVLNTYLLDYERREDLAQEKAVELAAKQSEFDAVKAEVDAARKSLDDAQSELTKATADLKSITEQIAALAPNSESLENGSALAALKRWLKEQPIINGFNPHLKIQYDWARDLKIQLGMANVTRVDRCRTCHVAIADFGAGNVPNFPADEYHQPFSAHPNPELFLTETSPHPLSTFACTVCHQGDGSGTAFQTAEHMASNPAMGAKWHHEFGWHKNHFWEYPMFPQQFTEASCLRCHPNVKELEQNPKFGNSAPTLVKGEQLIRQYGCFGCHEINGFDGPNYVGPDMRLEPQTAEEAQKFAEDPNQIPGKMRKVGPSFRHIEQKLTPEFIAHWVADPQNFRPTTKMPKPFGLTNQQDATAHAYEPVEIAGITKYLMAKSQPLETYQPASGYTPDSARGLELFKSKGCMACHQKAGEQLAGLSQDFGPDLSRIHEKIKPGPEGFQWLYTWIKEPTRYHPRTKMPDLFLDPYQEGETTIDPAADIAAFLLQGGATQFPPLPENRVSLGLAAAEQFTVADWQARGGSADDFRGVLISDVVQGSPAHRAERQVGENWVPSPIVMDDVLTTINGAAVSSPLRLRELQAEGRPGDVVEVGIYRNGQDMTFRVVRSTPLVDLVRMSLAKSLGANRVDEVFATRRYPVTEGMYAEGTTLSEIIKGDEYELAPLTFNEEVSEEEWQRRMEVYIGRKTISRYGCYGCHDIPGFESARPIGTALQDWGRKDTSKLAYEHIHEFLHHHGQPDGSSTAELMEHAVEREYGTPGSVDKSLLTDAYLYQEVISHGRAGFLWQKLRDPRSYDYMKTETKGWDERLRMPKFPFASDDIHAIATYVLGLVAEPPPVNFQYRPEGAAGAIVQGEILLEKYNCAGCHMLDMPVWEFAINPENLVVPDLTEPDKLMYSQYRHIKPPKHGWTGAKDKNDLPVLRASGYPQQYPDPEEDPEFQLYSFVAWDPIELGEGKLLMPGQPMAIQAANILKQGTGRGGAFTQWLIPQLPNKVPGVKDLNEAWQAAPPPLVGEGHKVQTPWLYEFLKNPEQLRHTTVLRMPRFNLDDDEARTLANYFAARDGSEFPYQSIPPRQPGYQQELQRAYQQQYPNAAHGALEASWLVLNGPLCRKCHEVGGNIIANFDPAQVKRGPNLLRVEKRLQPDFTRLWVYNPKWILPYTSMPQNFPPGSQSAMVEVFNGDNFRQAKAVVDALFNYTSLFETYGKTTYEPPGAAAEGAAPANPNPGGTN